MSNIIDDLKNLSAQQRRHILRAVNRHLKKLPTAHTIILTKKPTIKTAQVLPDFELIIFVNDSDDMRQMCDEVCDSVSNNQRKTCGDDQKCDEKGNHTVSDSSTYNAFGAKEETYRIFHPRSDYSRSARLVEPEESVALSYDFENIYKETHDSYLEFLERHLIFFVKKDFMNVTTVNTTEMEKDCPLYSRLYIIYHSKAGYVLYNRDVQPIVTINHRI